MGRYSAEILRIGLSQSQRSSSFETLGVVLRFWGLVMAVGPAHQPFVDLGLLKGSCLQEGPVAQDCCPVLHLEILEAEDHLEGCRPLADLGVAETEDHLVEKG